MRDTHVHCCEDFRGCRAGKMAGDITFVNEADIGFLSAVSLPNLSQALLDNFLDLDSEHESEDDSEDEWSDFSDLSSGNDSSDMSGEESPSRGQKDVRRKKVPKARNKQGNESSKEKRKKSSGKYLSNDDVKRLEETLKDGAYYCYCAYVLRISRYSDFLSPMLTNTGTFLRGLKLYGESRS